MIFSKKPPVIYFILFLFCNKALSATKDHDINRLSELLGMIDYCQYFYDSNDDPFKHAVMKDYNKKISIKVVELFSSKAESDMASRIRQDGYLQFKANNGDKKENIKLACSALDSRLLSLNLD